MEAVLAQPRGFCAGVVRAIDIVERALRQYGAPVYVFHEIVHNSHVVEDLRLRGAVFVDRLGDVAPGGVTVFSAHGVSNAVRDEARCRGLRVIDATCPLVEKVHAHARRYARLGAEIVLIGHTGHDEVVGTLGATDQAMHLVASVADVAVLDIPPNRDVAFITQTTLSVDDTTEIIAALRRRFPRIEGPETDDICYATQNRQNGLRLLAAAADLVLVVGDRKSSNTNRLRELAEQSGQRTFQIEDESQLEPGWLDGVARVGITAGASTPDSLVQAVCIRLRELGVAQISELPGVPERVVFRLPPEVVDQPVPAPRSTGLRARGSVAGVGNGA